MTKFEGMNAGAKPSTEVLKREYIAWAKSQLIQLDISQKELADKMGIRRERLSEAVNASGKCKKYIQLFIETVGTEKELDKYRRLYT